MSLYVYDDIIRLRLPDDQLKKFFKSLMEAAGADVNPKFEPTEFIVKYGTYKKGMTHVLDRLQTDDYKNRPGYILASCNRDRAIAAMQGPSYAYQERVLQLWLEVANTLTQVEKVFEGWDKI